VVDPRGSIGIHKPGGMAPSPTGGLTILVGLGGGKKRREGKEGRGGWPSFVKS